MSNVIVIKTQKEMDALPDRCEHYTRIEIRSSERIHVTKKILNSSVEAWGNSSVEAWGNSSVEAWENSSVEAWGNSSVVARGNSSVAARENSSVEAWGNSSVEAWGNSSVEAWENSSVVARGNSSVVARENSSVEAWENSSVVARENSSVEAQDFSMVAVLSTYVVVKKLLDYSVASFRGFKPKIGKRHKTATVIKTPKSLTHTRESFFDRLESDKKGTVILYKSVNPANGCDYRTGKIKYEGIVKCPDFDPDPERECGGGLHLSPTPGAARSYHQGQLLKCRVKKKDIVVNKHNITKVRCREVEVLGPLKK